MGQGRQETHNKDIVLGGLALDMNSLLHIESRSHDIGGFPLGSMAVTRSNAGINDCLCVNEYPGSSLELFTPGIHKMAA